MVWNPDNMKFIERCVEREQNKAKRGEFRIKEDLDDERKPDFEDDLTMGQTLIRNRAILLIEGLSKVQRKHFRRENLLAIQEKFYEVIERNPVIFRVPLLIHERKKILKERKYERIIDDNLEYEPDLGQKEIIQRSKIGIYGEMDRLKEKNKRLTNRERISSLPTRLKRRQKKRTRLILRKTSSLLKSDDFTLSSSTRGLYVEKLKKKSLGGIYDIIQLSKRMKEHRNLGKRGFKKTR